ncbi:hypothetical protein M9H77_11199 [Catharanthus roseus]|uniref:Uncharacterized protein n=1 Tax=Catharanthus roseus TaxID=4058 RepID=A0ACC0BDT4_CATRO|nr:hypothetical protein M9H77_11199 [Catharanthus roseus]
MKTLLRPPLLQQTFLPTANSPNPPLFIPLKSKIYARYPKTPSSSPVSVKCSNLCHQNVQNQPIINTKNKSQKLFTEELSLGRSKFVILGAITVGIAVLLMGFDDDQKALAFFGPEGPLVEEFWDNMRRYAIYALTVSTGVLYAVFQPILELLRNPISAILVLIIFGGSIYIVSQVLSAMVGVSEFSYDYSY